MPAPYNGGMMNEERSSPGRLWRNVPNAISTARLCATVVLLAAVVMRRVELFTWLLLACLVSDIVDGLIARAFHLTSKLGAALDSIADMLTWSIGLVGLVVFQRPFVAGHSRELALVAVLYVVEIVASFWRYGKLSSFHTLLARVAAYAGGIFVMALFLWGYLGWLFQAAVCVYVAALLEEMALICLLPEWSPNVGGLVRVLRRRGAES
jgi:CDP-diacylglycerol--glycerol-3-phosphate 3-phosphatidyltransferase